MSKGSTPRPLSVTPQQYADNWERTFAPVCTAIDVTNVDSVTTQHCCGLKAAHDGSHRCTYRRCGHRWQASK